jgi:xanthine dehydrogenase YagR molybdenum-binding subunit
MEAEALSLDINGERHMIETRADTAVDVIRGDLGLTGTKLVCGDGSCGTCVIQVDGIPVASCLLPVAHLRDVRILTIEGVGSDGLHPVQRAFVSHDALQCGFCTPGFVLEAVAFYDAWRAERGTERPTREEVAVALAGHLCRCGAYQGIQTAVQDACEGKFDTAPGIPMRVDAVDKVTGAARFTVDVSLPGMLHGRLVRSPLAHADLVGVDGSDAMALPGVEAFILLLPSDGRVRYVGEAFAAVAATDPATAQSASNAVVGHFVERAAVIGIDQALAEGAANLHGRGWKPAGSNEFAALPAMRRGNLRGPLSAASLHRFRARREVEAADPEWLIEHRWEFAAQSHTPFEGHACVADWTDDGLTVFVSTQSVSRVRQLIADHFGLIEEQVTVRADHVGGAFGAKQNLTQETIVAIELSRATGRPVRVAFDGQEELEVGGVRPGVRVDLALAGTAAGRHPSFTTAAYSDGGTSAGQAVATLQRFAYPGSPRSLLDYDVLTNGPPGRPMRAPGGPASFASLEGAVDEYAARLGRDAIEVRRSWGASGLQARVYDWASSRPLWRDRQPPGTGRFRVGVGVAFGLWAYLYDPDTRVEVRSSPDGFVVANAVQDLGTGTRTVLVSAVCEVFGVDRDLVGVEIGTSGHLWGPTSSASRTAPSVFPTATAAAQSLAARLEGAVRSELGMADAQVVPGGVSHAGEFIPWPEVLPRLTPMSEVAGRPADTRQPLTPTTIQGVKLGQGITRSAHIVEVEIDTRLGRIRPLRVDVVLAAGRIHVPDLARSQAYGGVVHGIGHALFEERILDPSSGLNVTTNFDQYRIAGIGDMPETTVEFIEEGFDHSPSGSAGLSELAVAAVPAATANAVSQTLGRRVTRLPIRPEHVISP